MSTKKASKVSMEGMTSEKASMLRIINMSEKRAINYSRWGEYILSIDKNKKFKLTTKGCTEKTGWFDDIEIYDSYVKGIIDGKECCYTPCLSSKTMMHQRIIMSSDGSYSVKEFGQISSKRFELKPRVKIKKRMRTY